MKTEKNRKLKGTVLFTVVAVLSIMIILMTCALAMAAAANRRSRKTYSSSQSNYTARTAIDSILAAIGTDANFSKAVRELGDGKSLDVVVDLNDASMGSIDNVVITRSGKRVVFDSQNLKWVERNLYTISADVTIGGETTSISSCILQDSPEGKKSGGGGAGGAAFLSFGAADVAQKAQSWGGTFIGMGEWTDKTTNQLVKWNSGDAFKYYYWNPTNSDGYKSDSYFTSIEDKKYLTKTDYNTKNAIAAETPFVVNGNYTFNTSAVFYYTYSAYAQNNKGVEIWGDFYADNSGDGNFKLLGSPKLVETLKAKGQNLDFMETPYFYVDGAIDCGHKGGNKIEVGDPNQKLPLNIFCGTLNIEGADKANFYGNVYCMDRGGQNKLLTKSTKLYSWANSAITGTGSETVRTGSLFCNGDIVLGYGQKDNTILIDGDLRVEGNIELKYGTIVEVTGDLVCGGQLIKGNDTKLTVHGTKYGNIGEVDKSVKTLKPGYEQKNVKAKRVTNFAVFHDGWNDSGLMGVMTPGMLAQAQAKYGVTGTDFGGKTIDPSYLVGGNYYHNYDSGKPTEEEYDMQAYYVQGTSTEVPEGTAVEYGIKLEAGVSPISAYAEKIYPNRAERDVLIGAERFLKVKGIAGRTIRYSEIPADEAKEMEKNVHKNSTGGLTVGVNALDPLLKGSCTLSGTFTGPVKIKPDADQTIYVLLKDAHFACTETTDDKGKVTHNNESYIDVDDSTGGKVYFVVAGTTDSEYEFAEDIADSRLVMTIADWMYQFNFNDSSKTNAGHEGVPISATKISDDANAIKSSNGKEDVYTPKYFKKQSNPLYSEEYYQVYINSDTTLSGSFGSIGDGEYEDHSKLSFKSPDGTLDIVVKVPKNEDDELWLTLEDVSLNNGWRILIDDTDKDCKGTVNIFIKGDVKLNSTGSAKPFCGIVSMKLVDAFADTSKKINIVSSYDKDIYNQIISTKANDNTMYEVLDPLQIAIYAGYKADNKTPSTLKTGNYAMIMGYIRGTETLDVTLSDGNNSSDIYNTIIYDGKQLSEVTGSNPPELKEGVMTGISVVGMFNVHECESDNDWEMLYVCPDPKILQQGIGGGGGQSSVIDAEGAHKYDAVEYTAFTR